MTPADCSRCGTPDADYYTDEFDPICGECIGPEDVA